MGPKRRRSSPWLLIAVSLALLLVPSSATQKTRLTALAGFIPFQALALRALQLPGHLLSSSGEAEGLRTQKDFLEAENTRLANENKRLAAQLDLALGMKQSVRDQRGRMLAADVVFPTDGSPWRKSLTLALGTRGGAEKGMLVLYNSQIVGRVTETGPWTSRVQTATDPGFRAGAVAVPRSYVSGVSFSERHAGYYAGTSGENGQLHWFTGDTPVESGALVLTTEDPINGVPRGLILGRVVAVNGGRGPFPKVDVEPILNFRGLEHVMLLVPPVETRPAGAPAAGRP